MTIEMMKEIGAKYKDNICVSDLAAQFGLMTKLGGSPRGVVANVLNCDSVVSEFELQSCYYVHFWINNLMG